MRHFSFLAPNPAALWFSDAFLSLVSWGSPLYLYNHGYSLRLKFFNSHIFKIPLPSIGMSLQGYGLRAITSPSFCGGGCRTEDPTSRLGGCFCTAA